MRARQPTHRIAAMLGRRQQPEAAARDPLLEHASPADRRIVEECMAYSMTGSARLLAVVDAVRYCVTAQVPGAFAECGVWRGGSVLAMIRTLQELDATSRSIHLYDTFEGMTRPSAPDVSASEGSALRVWNLASEQSRRPWGAMFDDTVFSEQSVRDLLQGSGYPEELIHVVRGPVEDTIPAHAPEELAILRLDTDWYESTRHELVHLYPRLRAGGVLIIDDYGHWDGARKAVDEYFAKPPQPFLSRIDYTGRIAVKPAG